MINIKQGDCLELMKNIPDKSIDFILVDPPYEKIKAAKWDKQIPLDKLWKQYNRIIKDNGCIAMFGLEPFSSKVRISNPNMYRYDWIWHKNPTMPFMAHKRPMSTYENIMIFYKLLPTYNPQMRSKGKWRSGITKNVGKTRQKDNANILYGVKNQKGYRPPNGKKRFPVNLIYYSNSKNQYVKSYHPTQKPIKLLEYLIRTYTNEQDTILDNCLGGGSTAIAAINTNRNFIGYELDNYYYKVAKNRVNNHLKEKEGAKVD